MLKDFKGDTSKDFEMMQIIPRMKGKFTWVEKRGRLALYMRIKESCGGKNGYKRIFKKIHRLCLLEKRISG